MQEFVEFASILELHLCFIHKLSYLLQNHLALGSHLFGREVHLFSQHLEGLFVNAFNIFEIFQYWILFLKVSQRVHRIVACDNLINLLMYVLDAN